MVRDAQVVVVLPEVVGFRVEFLLLGREGGGLGKGAGLAAGHCFAAGGSPQPSVGFEVLGLVHRAQGMAV